MSAANRGDNAPEYLLAAEVLRPHGVRGEVRLKILTDYPERLADLDSVHIGRGVDQPVTTYHVEKMRIHQGFGILKLKEIGDRDIAERLRGQFIMVALEDAIPLEDGEFYLYELIGLAVRTADDPNFGTLVEVLETGANDVYIIESAQYGQVLIPAVDGYVLETNIDEGYLLAHIPPELRSSRPTADDPAEDE